MTPSVSGREPIEKLAEEFAERYRRGERPSLAEYAERYPDLAEQIRELFPALVMMEEFGSIAAGATGTFRPRAERSQPVAELLGEYRILREVGRGGMGVVYEAVQESLGRHVAIKVLPVHSNLNPTLLERFRREARAAAGLHHTNIVPVFGVGEADGIHYYAMQFIQGHSLNAILDELRRKRDGNCRPSRGAVTPRNELTVSLARSLVTGAVASAAADSQEAIASDDVKPGLESAAAPEAASRPMMRPTAARDAEPELTSSTEVAYYRSIAGLGVQAAEALAYAHAQGILHRDVKPSNLLLDTRGTLWITDFGLAKASDSAELTQLGDIVGTLRYMAPERFQGQSQPRSDIYSLGATLYELLTLQPAFDSVDRVRLIEQITHQDPPLPRRRDPRIPRDLETIVLKAMAKDSKDRYADAALLAEDLRRFLADRPILARRTSVLERTWRWCRRNPALAALATSVVVLLVALAAGSSVAAIWLAEERTLVLAEGKRAQEAEQDLRREKDNTTQLLDSYLSQLRLNRAGHQPGHRWKSLEVLAGLAAQRPSLELRNEAIPFLTLTDLKPGPSWNLEPGWQHGPVFDHAFERYAVSDSDNLGGGQGHISIRRLADHRELAALPGFGVRTTLMHFSPDGRFLAVKYHDAREIHFGVWDVQDGRILLKQPQGIMHSAVDFRPDSGAVAVGGPDGVVRIFALPGGKLAKTLPRGVAPYALRYQPGGKQLAVSSLASTEVEIRDLQTDRVVALPHPTNVRGLTWRRDGRLLATAGANGWIYLWDPASPTQALMKRQAHDAAAAQVAFSHSGELLISQGWDGTSRLWDVGGGRQLLSVPSPQYAQFSPDDRYLAPARDGLKVWLWEIVAGSECRTFRGHTGLLGAAVSPDGHLLASAGQDGIRLWNLHEDDESRKLLALLPGAAFSVMFQAKDGSLIASGSAGLLRWPIARDGSDAEDLLRIGPAEALGPAEPRSLEQAVVAPDGNRVALNSGGGWAQLIDLDQTTPPQVLQGQRGITPGNFSPDGRWLCTGNWQGESGVWIWDARQGKPIHKLPLQGSTTASFSPDGKWLVTSTATDYAFWEPGSWKAARTIPREGAASLPARPVFSRDGAMVALARSRTEVRLVDPATGDEFATLPTSGGPLCFSADGSLLVTAGASQAVQVWNLRRIREGLATLNLDWDAPPYPRAAAKPHPIRVQDLHFGDSQNLHRARIDHFAKLVARNPDNATACNNLAWLLLSGPESIRNPKRALPLAEKAVKLDGSNPHYANTLAVALYRLGQPQSARDLLERNLAVHEEVFRPFDLFLLAMSYYHLGEPAKARDCYERAVALVEENRRLYSAEHRGDLSQLEAEAELLLDSTRQRRK